MGSSRLLSGARAHWHWLLPAGVILALLAPMLLTDRTYSTDWPHHLWLIWAQGLNIRDLGEPSYYLQSDLGLFYPYYAFYGGTFYAVAGLVSWAASPKLAVILAYALALAASYLGWTWIARQAGVDGWRAQLPGCIAVTAPLAVTNLYGRGDIPEVVATAAIPLVVAAALSIFRAPRVGLAVAALYVIAIVALTGTHTLTLAWGTIFLAFAAALLAGAHWRTVAERWRRGRLLAGLTALGLGINAWVLAPLVLLHAKLVEQEPDPIGSTEYTSPERLFSLLRDAGNPYPLFKAQIEAQLPVLVILWALVCGAVFWGLLPAARRAVAGGLLALGTALLLLVLSPSLIEELPRVLQFIQFPYRVLTYVDLCVVGLVVLALAAMERDRAASRLPVLALAAIAAFNFAISVKQVLDAPSWLPGRDVALASSVHRPVTWYSPLHFADGSAPVVKPTLRPLAIAVEDRRDVYGATYPPGRAGTVETNIAAGDYLVDVSGARPVGRTGDGRMVLRLPASPDRPRHVEVRADWGAGVTAGRWLTVLSLLTALGGAVAWLLVGRRRRGEG
jgi:hypothetical protein